MSLLTNVVGEAVKRTSGLIAASSDYSCAFWFRPNDVPTGGKYRTLWAMLDDPAVYLEYIGIYTDVDTNNVNLNGDDGSGIQFTSSVPLVLSYYNCLWYTRDGDQNKIYLNGTLIGTLTLDFSAATFGQEWLLDDGVLNNATNSNIFGFREWNSVRTIAQLVASSNSTAPDATAYCDTPLLNDLLDDSGNGRDWTAVGSTSFQATPLQSPTTNFNSATAFNLGTLPAEFVQVHDTTVVGGISLVNAFSWLKYTAGASAEVLGIYFRGLINGAAGSFEVATQLSLSPPTIIAESFENCNIQLPIDALQTFYLPAINRSGTTTPTSSVLWINVVKASTDAIVAGYVFIRTASITDDLRDDAGWQGLPGGFIDPATQTIKNFIPKFITGEDGDILPNGISLWCDEFDGIPPAPTFPDKYCNLYDPDFNFITRFLLATYTGRVLIRANNATGRFWVIAKPTAINSASYASVDDDGTVSALQALPSPIIVNAHATNNAETILYNAPFSTSNVKRWDMVGLAFLSDLVATVANYRVTDLLNMSDDSVIICYFKSSVVRSMYCQRYSAAGALLNTYAISLSEPITSVAPRLGYSANSPEAFWVLNHLSTGFGDIQLVRISDGVILKHSITPDLIQTQTEQLSPDLIMTSDSCPIIEIRQSITPPTTGTIIVIKVTVPTADPQSFDFTAGGGLSPGTFSLLDGEQITFEDVPVGDGYSIEEDAVPNWTTEYEVSNDSPIDDISVGSGEVVIVTVTNTQIVNSLSGIYKVVPKAGKRNDTIYTDLSASPPETEDVKIPRPFARGSLLGQ